MKAKKLPSGSYREQVVAGFDENGKRIVKSFTAETEWEALRMADMFRQSLDEMTDQNITVAVAMQQYIDSRANVIKKTTLRSYHQIAEGYFKCLHHVKLRSLKAMDVQKAVNLESGRVSAKSIKNAFGFLKSVLKMHEVNINLDRIQLPKIIKQEKELPTVETVFQIVHGTEIELPCLLSVWLSLRIGEVVGLQFKDIDKKQRTIKVRRTIIQTETGCEVRNHCKTEGSTRGLQLPEYLFNMIDALPRENESEFIVKLSRKALYSRFKRMMKRNGYPELTYHDLRHICAPKRTSNICPFTRTGFCC